MKGVNWHYICHECGHTIAVEIYTAIFICPECGGYAEAVEMKDEKTEGMERKQAG